MIKFFRKIRQKLLKETRFRSYLIYALGEILLIVLGILIALQVSNWNERNKKTKSEVVYLKEIRKSLLIDLENEIIPCIENHKNSLKADSILRINFYESTNQISQDSIFALFSTIFDNWDLILNTVAYDNIKSIGIDLISNDTLRIIISNLYGYDFKVLAHLQSESDKYFNEQFSPIWTDVWGEWRKDAHKSKGELELIRKNSQLLSALTWSNHFTYDKLHYLKEYEPHVIKVIDEIGKEIERLENK